EIHGLTVASPFEALQNLLQADALVADLEPLLLLEKKLVIDRLTATGLKFGTARLTDGRAGGRSDGVMGQVTRWGEQLQVPALALPTGKISAARLDPAQLTTPRAAAALGARADSARQAWDSQLKGLDVAATADSARRMAERLRGAKATDVKLLGDARRTLGQLKQAQDRVTALERSATSGIAALQAGAAGLTDAKQRDYATARGLLKLPGLDAPDIGAALFGPAAVGRFQRALHWVELGQRYGAGLPVGCAARPRTPHASRHRYGEPRRGRAASALAAVTAHPARAGVGHGGAQPRGAGRRGSRALDHAIGSRAVDPRFERWRLPISDRRSGLACRIRDPHARGVGDP